MICKNKHRYDDISNNLLDDQGGAGRHHFVGCAYYREYNGGVTREEQLNELGRRPKSLDATYALGYLKGPKIHIQ